MKITPLEIAQMRLGEKKLDSDFHFSHETKKEVNSSTDSGERASDECVGDNNPVDMEYFCVFFP